MSYILTDLENGDLREGGWFILIHYLGGKINTSWKVNLRVHVQLVYDTGIIGGCCYMITTWGSRGYSVNHIIIGFMETVDFNGSLSFEIRVDLLGPWRSSSSGPGGGR